MATPGESDLSEAGLAIRARGNVLMQAGVNAGYVTGVFFERQSYEGTYGTPERSDRSACFGGTRWCVTHSANVLDLACPAIVSALPAIQEKSGRSGNGVHALGRRGS